MKSIFKNSFFNIIYTLLNILFPLVTSIIVSRVLLADGVGKVSYAQNIVSYFVLFAGLGLPVYGVKCISKARKKGVSDINSTFSELFIINAVSTTVSVVAYAIFVLASSNLNDVRFLYLAAGIQVILCYANIDWLYKGVEKYKYIAIRSFIIKVLCLIAVVVFVRHKEDYIIYALISSCAIAGNHILNIINARKIVRISFKRINIKQHIKPLVFLSLITFFTSVYNKIDIVMLGKLTSDYNVGIYSNAHKMANLVLSCTTSITAVFLPRLASYSDNKEDFKLLLKNGSNIISIISVPAAIGLFIIAPQLVTLLYGSGFSDSSYSLRIFCLMIVIVSFGDLFCYQALIALGMENKRLLVTVIGTIANVGLNILLIPTLKESGAAIASLVSEILINFYLFYAVCKKLSYKVDLTTFLKSVLAALAMASLIVVIPRFLKSNLAICLVSVFIGVGSYFLMSLLLRNEPLINLLEKIKIVKGKKHEKNN